MAFQAVSVAVFMNAGAYGERSRIVLVSGKVWTKDGGDQTLSAGESSFFGYRHSKIQETGAVVTSAKLLCRRQSRGDQAGDGSVDPSSSVETTLEYPSWIRL